jgi:hypothetical protein
MSSLTGRIELLESDLKAVPPRISVYHDLPFAIFRYDPGDEWELRQEVRLLATRLLEAAGKEVHQIPMSEFLWRAIDETEGMEEVVGLERSQGYKMAQRQVTTYLSNPIWRPLATMITERLSKLDPARSIAFLTRAAAMAPGIYYMSKLLDEMHAMHDRTRVTTILFYPGSIEGTTGLRFMDLKDRDAIGNYRVKIYG